MTRLFEPLRLRGVTFRNRIWVSPMCMYSAEDGVPNDWHLVHLGSRAVGGAALVMAEATGVSAEGRISPGDTGLWNARQVEAFRRITEFVAARGAVAGIQLAHAGRKASTDVPWKGGRPLAAGEGAWTTLGPSQIPFDRGFPPPHEMTLADIDRVADEFTTGARRAVEAGFGVVEVHAAHGYLLHEFLSPLSNRRAGRATGLSCRAPRPRAHLGDGLGGRRMGPPPVDRAVEAPEDGGRGSRGLLERRPRPVREGPRRTGLSGPVRGSDPSRGWHPDRGRGDDHRAATGGGDPRHGAGRRDRHGARLPARSLLAVPRRTGARRGRGLAGAIRTRKAVSGFGI